MKATCPHCGLHASFEAFLMDTDAKAAVVAASTLPSDLQRLVWSYLGLYRKPDAKQVMTWQRAQRLIVELSELVKDPQIQWDGGRVVPNSVAYWVQAIQRVLEMPTLRRPLDGPNLIRKIAYELAERDWHQGNAHREKEASQRSKQNVQSEITHDQQQNIPVQQPHEYNAVPLSEGLKGWRERFGQQTTEDK